MNNLVPGTGITGYPTNPYYDVICIVYAASLFCISSINSRIGQRNIFFYFIGICTLISGVLVSILFSTRFSVFALVVSLISTFFVFRKFFINKLKEIKIYFLFLESLKF